MNAYKVESSQRTVSAGMITDCVRLYTFLEAVSGDESVRLGKVGVFVKFPVTDKKIYIRSRVFG